MLRLCALLGMYLSGEEPPLTYTFVLPTLGTFSRILGAVGGLIRAILWD
jgi:hypothetical protein